MQANITRVIESNANTLESYKNCTDKFIKMLVDELSLKPSKYSVDMLQKAISDRIDNAILGNYTTYIKNDLEKRFNENPEWIHDTKTISDAFSDYSKQWSDMKSQNTIDQSQHNTTNVVRKPVQVSISH